MEKIISKYNNADKGFSLLEVMVALVVFSISFLGFYSLQLSAVNGNSKARAVTTSVVWASDMIERLLNLDYDDPLLDDDDANGMAGLDATIDSDGSQLSEDGLYTLYWNVAVDKPIVNVKHIRVFIVKNGGVGSDIQNIFNYYKSNKF